MKWIEDTFARLERGRIMAFGGLALVPLIDRKAVAEPGYLTLDEALRTGRARITELSESGSVPELRLVNEADRPVLLLDGEQLVGAKQNRVLNLTILAPAGKTITIPVSCVEQGRWRHVSSEFQASPEVHFARGRAERMESVSESLEACQSAASDQGQVWSSIQSKGEAMRAGSETGAMQDIYRRHARGVEEYLGAFVPDEGQVGAVFALGGRVLGVEVLDHPATLHRMFEKLLRSWAIDAIEETMTRGSEAEGKQLPTVTDVEGFLAEIGRAPVSVFPAVGLGEDLRLRAPELAGAALAVDGLVVHLAAFRHRGNRGPRRTGRASRHPFDIQICD